MSVQESRFARIFSEARGWVRIRNNNLYDATKVSIGAWDSIIKKCWKKANIMYQEIEIENEEIVGLNESDK